MSTAGLDRWTLNAFGLWKGVSISKALSMSSRQRRCLKSVIRRGGPQPERSRSEVTGFGECRYSRVAPSSEGLGGTLNGGTAKTSAVGSGRWGAHAFTRTPAHKHIMCNKHQSTWRLLICWMWKMTCLAGRARHEEWASQIMIHLVRSIKWNPHVGSDSRMDDIKRQSLWLLERVGCGAMVYCCLCTWLHAMSHTHAECLHTVPTLYTCMRVCEGVQIPQQNQRFLHINCFWFDLIITISLFYSCTFVTCGIRWSKMVCFVLHSHPHMQTCWNKGFTSCIKQSSSSHQLGPSDTTNHFRYF